MPALQASHLFFVSLRFFIVGFVLLGAATTSAEVVAPPGHIYSPLLLGSATQSCVASGPGGTFVGIGPGFTANAQAIVFAKESGSVGLVALGFNSIGDCSYDPTTDTLYVSDNGLETLAAVTGDTVYAIPGASAARGLPAAGLELVPAGSVPFAQSLALDLGGDVLVGDAAGAGAGSVLRIDVDAEPPALSAFIPAAFDFTAGLALNRSSGDLFVAETTAAFETQIRRFDMAGLEGAPLCLAGSCPSGSFDLAFDSKGNLLATGLFLGEVIAYDPSGAPTPFVGGLTFATGMSVEPFTGRIDILSGFSGTDEDRTVHRFIPVERLAAGLGLLRISECVHELYGLELDATSRKAICVDGEVCDSDGRANNRCVFPVGFCLNVADPEIPECAPSAVSGFSLRVARHHTELLDAAARVQAALPVSGPACFLSDGVVVPVRVRTSGEKRAGRAVLRIRATRSGDALVDVDRVKLVCQPASS